MPRSLFSLVDRPGRDPVRTLLKDQRIVRAEAFFASSADRFNAEHIRICEIPAPPFKEHERGRYFAARFIELGLADVHTDSVGNVIGFRRGVNDDPIVVLSAHLDTVFPEGTDVRVRREGDRLCAPGIADNAAGLAALIALIQALNAAQIRTKGTLAFVATVGEEGEGNLRGVRHLFSEGKLAGRVASFISFDGPGLDYITNQALGSRRYRVRFSGPGGHSWADFGVVNPVHAVGSVVALMSAYHAPAEPRTTFNIGRIAGGESVNVIPAAAEMDVDLRSASDEELNRIEDHLLNAVHRAAEEENTGRGVSGQSLQMNVQLIGDRPAGETPASSMLVRAALSASRACGIDAILNRASTDSNIPISLGIPAVTIGTGGAFNDAHRLSEWYDPAGRETGYRRAMLLSLAMTGLAS